MKKLFRWLGGSRGATRRRESGFSTIETLISMGVVLVASLSVATSTATSYKAVDRAEQSLNLENALRETVETVHAVAFQNLETLDANEVYATDKMRPVILRLTVSQISPALKAVQVDVFEKVKSGSVWVAGEKITHALIYRADR